MREYFNKAERDTHIVLLIMTEALSAFKGCTSLTEEEQNCLAKAEEQIRKFTDSVYERFGDAYKRKIKGTLECNTVKVCSKYNSERKLSYCDINDLACQVDDMIAAYCVDCDKCDFKTCPTYCMAVTCGVEGKNESGCPYKW